MTVVVAGARRRRERLALALVSLAAHALLLGALVQPSGPRPERGAAAPASAAQATRIRWVRPITLASVAPSTSAAMPPNAAAAVDSPRSRTRPPERARRAHVASAEWATVARLAAPETRAAAAEMPSAAPPPAIDGSVFALPRLGLPQGPRDLRAAGARRDAGIEAAVHDPRTQAPVPPPLAHQAALRDAARHQLQVLLDTQLSAWQALPGSASAACRVSADGADPACDHEALREQVRAHAGVLAGLLAAYHGIEPRIDALDIRFEDGRYRAAWRIAGAP